MKQRWFHLAGVFFLLAMLSTPSQVNARRGRHQGLRYYQVNQLHKNTQNNVRWHGRKTRRMVRSQFRGLLRSNGRLLSMQQRILRHLPKGTQHQGAWIPLALYQQLLAQQKQKAQKDDIRIGEARYVATYVKGGFVVQGTLTLEASTDGWHRHPLLYKQQSLLRLQWLSTVGPVHMLPIQSGSQFVELAYKGKGRRVLQILYYVPATTGLDPQVTFHFPKASATHLKVVFPSTQFHPSIRGGIGTQKQKSHGKVTLSTRLPGKTNQITLRWWKEEAKSSKPSKNKRVRRQSRLYAQSFALLSLGQGGQELFFTVRYTIVHATRERFRMYIPTNINVRRVLGLGIRDYRLTKVKGKPYQLLDVLLVEPVGERYELSILGERRVKQNKLTLLVPQVLDVQRESGYLGVEVTNNDEITVVPHNATTVDSRELPTTISQGTSRPILYASRFSRHPVRWELTLRRHTNTSVPAAMVDFARVVQVSNHTGQVWVHATWQLRNTFKQFIAITLPKGSIVRSSFVGGKPAKPARDTRNRVLVPLKRSGGASGSAFSVELIYSLKGHAFRGISKHQFALPRIDLWISRLEWRLYIPDGQAKWKGKFLTSKHLLRVRSRFTRFFRGKLKNRPMQAQIGQAPGAPPALANNQGVAGILPIRINLPRTGRLYYFSRYHLSSKDKTAVRLLHRTPWMQTVGLLLFVLVGFLLAIGAGIFGWLMRKKAWVYLTMVAAAISGFFATSALGLVQTDPVFIGAMLGAGVTLVIQFLRFLDQRRKQSEPA